MKDSIQKKCDRCEATFTLYKQDYCEKAQQKGWWQNKKYCSRSCSFVALKLEDASDREIADCLGINVSAIPKMIVQLQKCV